MCSDHRLFSLHTNNDGDIFFISTCNSVCYGQHVHVHTNSWVQILQRFTNSHNNVKNNVESIQDGQARSGRETKDQRRKVGGRRSREGINNISAQLILFPLSIKSFFHASIGIPVGHFTASLAGHFACNQNGTLSLWSIHCSPDSIYKQKSPC